MLKKHVVLSYLQKKHFCRQKIALFATVDVAKVFLISALFISNPGIKGLY